MKQKILLSFESLSMDEMAAMARSIKSGTFTLSAEDSTPATVPDGVFDLLGTGKFYKDMLLDETAFFKCIFLSFAADTENHIKIPVALFGVSLKNKAHFPIIIGNIITALITFDRGRFSQLLKFETESDEAYSWAELGGVKKDLMGRIFSFYERSGGEYHAFMAWGIKSEKSLTRKIAEASSFKRLEIAALKTEVYYNKPLDEKELKYIHECVARWIDLAPSEPQREIRIIDPQKYVTMITLFLKILADLD